MKPWINFKSKNSYINEVMRQRKCWEKCFDCEDKFVKSETKNVHMIVDVKKGTQFICDKCLYENYS